jgi:hypothetical protein
MTFDRRVCVELGVPCLCFLKARIPSCLPVIWTEELAAGVLGLRLQTDACGYPRGTLCDFEHGADVTVLEN